MSNLPNAHSREEILLKAIAESQAIDSPEPKSRVEIYLKQIMENGSISPEEIQAAVDAYLAEHPLEMDASLVDPLKAAPAGVVGERLSELKGDISALNGDVNDIKSLQRVNISGADFGVTRLHDLEGYKVSCDVPFSQNLQQLLLFGKTRRTKNYSSRNIFTMADRTVEKTGLSFSYVSDTNTITLSGTALEAQCNTAPENMEFNLDDGFVGSITIKKSASTNLYLNYMVQDKDGIKTFGNNKTSNRTLIFDGTQTLVRIYFTFSGIVGETYDLTDNPQINIGETVLEYDQCEYTYGMESLSGECTVDVNNAKLNIGNIVLRGVQQKFVDNSNDIVFNYSDSNENIYFADYIDIINKKLVRNVGYIESYNGEDVGDNYVCNADALTNGVSVAYILKNPVITELEDIVDIGVVDGVTNVENTLNAWMKVSYLVKNESVYSLKMFSEKIGYRGRLIGIHDGYLYTATQWLSNNKLFKYKLEYGNPALEKTYTGLTPGMQPNGIDFYGEYIYVTDRNLEAALANTKNYTGTLYVLQTLDLAEIAKITLPWKGCDCRVYKHYLFVALQMYGFQIYDIATPDNPVLIFNHDCGFSKEFQQFAFYSYGGREYVAISAYGYGISFWDITEPASAVNVDNFSIEQWRQGTNTAQIMGILASGDYIYCTLSRNRGVGTYSHAFMGILRIHIPDFTYITGELPQNYRASYCGEGDPHPSEIIKYGRYIVTNCGRSGLAVWDAETCEFRSLIDVDKDKKVSPLRIALSDDGQIYTYGGHGVSPDDNKLVSVKLLN